MEIRERQEIDAVVGYTCDICLNNCRKVEYKDWPGAEEHATLSAQWGYFSRDKDHTWHECHMCEDCFDKVKAFIENELKGTLRTGELIVSNGRSDCWSV